ncbi:MAG: hypothetical protein IPG78_07040 [Ignavibacteria bacterium]|nr:hypothetical protein [Ignavibacteria bacterium]
MKSLRILIFFIIFPISSFCQEEYKNIEDMARKNSSYRIIETKYMMNERDFSKTDSILYEFNSDYKISGIKDLKVISSPKITKIFKYNSEKMLIGGDENEKLTFKLSYDDNGLLKTKKYYDKSGKIVNTVRYQYGKNKKLKSIRSSINNYQIENLYLNDLLVKSVITNNSRNKTEIEFNYDSYKNLIAEKSFRSLKDSKTIKDISIIKLNISIILSI